MKNSWTLGNGFPIFARGVKFKRVYRKSKRVYFETYKLLINPSYDEMLFKFRMARLKMMSVYGVIRNENTSSSK